MGVPWPAFEPTSGAYLALNATAVPGHNLKTQQCALWDRVHAARCQVLTCPCPCETF